MKERELTPMVLDENPEIFELDEKGMAAYEKAKKEILFLMHTIDEWAKDRTLEVGQKNNYCGLLESYVQNYTKTLEYAGEIDAAKQQRYAEIRELNQENRELRRQLGEKVSLEDIREKLKNIRDQFAKWWNINGFGFQREERFIDGGFFTELSGHITDVYYDDNGMSEKEKVAHLQTLGFTISDPNDKFVDFSDNNIALLNRLLTTRFPSAQILEIKARNYQPPIKISDVKIVIRDFNDFGVKEAK